MDRDRYTGYHTDPLAARYHREDYYPWDWDSGTHGGGGFSLSSVLGLLIGFVVVGGILLIAYLIWLFLKWMVQQAHRGNGPALSFQRDCLSVRPAAGGACAGGNQ